ncbi:MAG: pyridoxal-phosphate-dependent aminotransferase family protein [Vampirovibrionales bacterium]
MMMLSSDTTMLFPGVNPHQLTTHLMIPGPTPLPDAVRQALSRPAIGHRSPEFKAILKRVLPRLQRAFNTQQPVLLYTASGTGAMEAALSNTLNAGDRILCLTCGVFSQRFAEIAKTLGLRVEVLAVAPGQSYDLAAIQARLTKAQQEEAHDPFKAVTMIHSETSTGVLNPIAPIAAMVREYGALVIVDTVTGAVATPFHFDEWDVDIAVTGSQKGFMIPPGLAFLALSQRALEAHERCERPGFYFNFKKTLKAQADFTTAWTPATNLIEALDVALEMIETEGWQQVYTRHELLTQMTRAGLKALGLKPLVAECTYASRAVTSVRPPEGISVDALRKTLKQGFGITVADGQKELKGSIFRIGHLGHVSPRDTLMTLAALEASLVHLGHELQVGASTQAAMTILLNAQVGERICCTQFCAKNTPAKVLV